MLCVAIRIKNISKKAVADLSKSCITYEMQGLSYWQMI